MDALTHAIEALTSTRANYVSDILALQAAEDIISFLPEAYRNGKSLPARERLMNASMIAGMAFTNVSLGIVHSMAHILGGVFKISHGLADAVLLPYVIGFNSADSRADVIYTKVAKRFAEDDLSSLVRDLNEELDIPANLSALIGKDDFMYKLDFLAEHALLDGCTKTNPIIPSHKQLKWLFIKAYEGDST